MQSQIQNSNLLKNHLNMNIKRQFSLLVAVLLGFNLGFAQTYFSKPISVEILFQIAESKNRMLKVYSFDEKITAQKVQNERKKQLPTITAALNFSYNGDGLISDRNFSNIQQIPIPGFGNNFSLQAKQLVYAGGALKKSIENSEIDNELASLSLKEEQQNILFLLAGNYLELQKLNNQEEVIVKNIEQTNELIEEITRKVEGGIVLKNNITRLELQKQSLNLKLLQIKKVCCCLFSKYRR